MEIKIEDDKRQLNGVSDRFLRVVSKEGVNKFPTVLLLSNRLFLNEESPIRTNAKINKRIKENDDFIWYKTSSFQEVKHRLIALFRDIAYGDEYVYNKTTFFRKENKNINASNYYYSGSVFYYKLDGGMRISKLKLFDSAGSINFLFPEKDGRRDDFDSIVSICRFNNSIDLIATKNNLYTYDHTINKIVMRFSLDRLYDETDVIPENNSITSMCKLENGYVIVASKYKFGIIKDILNQDDISLRIVKYETWWDESWDGEGIQEYNNGLPEDSSFTFCFPYDSSKVEINGQNNLSCIFDCNADEEETVHRAGVILGGERVYYYNNEPVLFAGGCAYDINRNVFSAIENGYKYFISNGYIVVFSKDSKVYIDRVESGAENPIAFDSVNGVIEDIEYGFIDEDDNIYFGDSKNNIVCSYKDSENCSIVVYQVCFNFRKDEDKENFDMGVFPVSFLKLVDIYSGQNNDIFSLNVNGKDASFVFIVIDSEKGKTKWIVIGDDDRSDNELKYIYNAFDISV
jgi:hypothetical protein